MHFLLQLCEPGHILGACAAPRLGLHPTPGLANYSRPDEGRRAESAALCASGTKGFLGSQIRPRHYFGKGGGDLWPAYLIEIDGGKMRGWYG